MNYSIKSLEGRIPADVYNLLISEDYMSFPCPKEEDIDKAYAIIAPPDVPRFWFPVGERTFTSEEIKTIKSCTVAKTKYGLIMKFVNTDGKESSIPCSTYHLFEEGQEWYPESLKVIELRKWSEKDSIYRVAPVTQHVDIKEYPQMSYEEYNFRINTVGTILSKYTDLRTRDGYHMDIFKYLRLY